MGKDYYKTLGIEKDASEHEIKKAYLRQSSIWHPDKHHSKEKKAEAEEKFKEINDAYSVLKDEEKRAIYDEGGSEAIEAEENGDNININDPFAMFPQIFGNNFNMRVSATPNLEMPIQCTLEELYTGVKKEIEVRRMNICDKCDGKGLKDKKDICKKCKGNGTVMMQMGPNILPTTCTNCYGNGFPTGVAKCKKCNGRKCYGENVKYKVNVPPGAYHKFPVIIEDEGHQIPPNEVQHGGPTRSNVVFYVDENPHSTLKRGIYIPELNKLDKSTLYYELNISFAESLVGFEKNISHLCGKKIKFGRHESTRHNDIFVIKDFGMPLLTEKNKNRDDDEELEKGVLIIKINVENLDLSPNIKKQLWSLLSSGKPYPKFTPTKLDVLTFTEYKDEVNKKNMEENLKNKYKSKMFNRHSHDDTSNEDDNDDNDNDDDDDDDDDDGFDMQNIPGLPPGMMAAMANMKAGNGGCNQQ